MSHARVTYHVAQIQCQWVQWRYDRKHDDLSEWDPWVEDSWINKGLTSKPMNV